jgi:16S rRNA (guanine527-N7)-methyltransferase
MYKDRATEIREEFQKAGLPLSPGELHKFILLDNLLLRKKDELDLTRIDSKASIVKKHYLDSALAGEYIREDTEFLMDLGSGAGFPGLAIAIRKPQIQLLLAEPRLKRLTFLDEAIELLELENVELYPHKVGPRFGLPVDGIVSRDFLPLGETLELCAPILKKGARLYLMKGPNIQKELRDAEKLESYSEFAGLELIPYSLDGGNKTRFIVRLRKKTDKKNLNKTNNGNSSLNLNKSEITEIASQANSRFKGFLRLVYGKNIKKTGVTLASGKKIVKELSLNHPNLIKGILAKNLNELDGFEFPSHAEIFLLRSEIFPLVDIFGTGAPVLLINAPELKPFDLSSSFTGIRLFVPFQDPANVGSIVRTAGSLGAGVVLLKEAANPYHPKALRAAGSIAFQTEIFKGPALSELPLLKIPDLFALSASGEDIYKFEPRSNPLNLVIGLEGPGLDKYWPEEKRLKIPMREKAESLNAAVAAAIALAILSPKMKS